MVYKDFAQNIKTNLINLARPIDSVSRIQSVSSLKESYNNNRYQFCINFENLISEFLRTGFSFLELNNIYISLKNIQLINELEDSMQSIITNSFFKNQQKVFIEFCKSDQLENKNFKRHFYSKLIQYEIDLQFKYINYVASELSEDIASLVYSFMINNNQSRKEIVLKLNHEDKLKVYMLYLSNYYSYNNWFYIVWENEKESFSQYLQNELDDNHQIFKLLLKLYSDRILYSENNFLNFILDNSDKFPNIIQDLIQKAIEESNFELLIKMAAKYDKRKILLLLLESGQDKYVKLFFKTYKNVPEIKKLAIFL